MFSKILIANRGEIACRVARTARRLGVRTVAVYSDADVHALHVELCDEAYRVGASRPRDSYLNADAIIRIARESGAEAIHPGYGFLSENESFAAACAKAGVVFIGPPPAAIAAMGSKSAAKTIMAKAGVPLVPGYHGDDQSPMVLAREAAAIGYPVLIKATAGGGGKGMKVASDANDFSGALASAQREAKSSFGDDRVLVEKYLVSPRHIEIQVFADTHGNAVYLFERDCSVQRRHQKIIEEAPAPGMTRERRKAMGEAAVTAARSIRYVGAGTVEFIAEQDGTFHFMEMNTRLQVEHPVTEMITGIDLVEWQLRIASGEPLPKMQDELAINGHAIEARIYAEDPERGFLPSIGSLVHWRMPSSTRRVRVDTGVRAGDAITPFYDPMLAKLIVWGEDRERASQEMLAALGECEVVGVATNIAFLERLVKHEAFASGQFDTGIIDKHRIALFPSASPTPPRALLAAALAEYLDLAEAGAARAALSSDPYSPWHSIDAWWNASATYAIELVFAAGQARHAVKIRARDAGRVHVAIDGTEMEAYVIRGDGRLIVEAEGTTFSAAVVRADDERWVFANGLRRRLTLIDPLAHTGEEEAAGGHLMAPMSGTIVSVLVKAGDRVEKGKALIVLEAMKMEHTIAAPIAGVVTAVNYGVGDRVPEGADLVDLDESSS
ncbi:MAG TPA: acetyl/propionyl/methylcrotonyl-CoA carboxylase subunit alpha [Casimicrobiaceae bacterium]